jgi:hypothetical protein
MRKSLGWVALVLFLSVTAGVASAADFDSVVSRWTQQKSFADRGDSLDITATYYAAEMVEALVQKEADKNLWTADETEKYKYQFLNILNLTDTIPVRLEFANYGAALHMSPFGEQVTLMINGKKYKPKDYEPRFNFRVQGKIDGFVYFPRYDEKTGKDLLKGAGMVKLLLSSGISMTLKGRGVEFLWDVSKDNPERLFQGKAAARLEMDRLLKRLQKLNDERKTLEGQLETIRSEITQIESRMAELQKQ